MQKGSKGLTLVCGIMAIATIFCSIKLGIRCILWGWYLCLGLSPKAGCWLWKRWLLPRSPWQHWLHVCCSADLADQRRWVGLLGLALQFLQLHGKITTSEKQWGPIWVQSPWFCGGWQHPSNKNGSPTDAMCMPTSEVFGRAARPLCCCCVPLPPTSTCVSTSGSSTCVLVRVLFDFWFQF